MRGKSTQTAGPWGNPETGKNNSSAYSAGVQGEEYREKNPGGKTTGNQGKQDHEEQEFSNLSRITGSETDSLENKDKERKER